MKVLIAPDSFKESLSAREVAEAIARGVLEVCGDAQVDLCPMADGGEGTVEAMVVATAGRFVSTDVFGPRGEPRRARFGLLGARSDSPSLPGAVALETLDMDGAFDEQAWAGKAVVEMAAASGLMLLGPDRRDPLRTTTYGTGQLISAALDEGARDIVLGIGGSATVDGGVGCAQALGVRFLDESGEPCRQGLAGGDLTSIATIDTSQRDPRLDDVHLRIACDVNNPLTGPDGAAAVYGPQKGASPEAVEKLQAGLSHLAELLRRQVGIDVEYLEGAGASGGLGAGLVALAGASLENGGRLISEAVGLPRRLKGADLCITGEGRFDGQSGYGKVPVRVQQTAGRADVPTLCIAGSVSDDAPRQRFCDVLSLVGEEVTLKQAMARPAEILTRRARQAMQRFVRD